MTKAELLKAIGQADRLIAKASIENVSDGYDGFIEDFSASIELGEDTLDFPWENEDSECIYNDCRGED